MDKEFDKVTQKLEDMHLLVQSNDFSEENVNMIFSYSNDLLAHNERLSQMLTELPLMTYSDTQGLQRFNTDSTMELVANEEESELNQNNILLNFLNHIDISELLMHMKQLLMERIDEIISVSIQLIFFISTYVYLLL